MENHEHCELQKENSADIVKEDAMSGGALSFSLVPTSVQQQEVVNQEPEFEFGCVTPESRTSDSNKDSPADLLFFNGKLLPHSFPFHHKSFKDGTNYISSTNGSTRIRRTSSIGSKDSLYSFTSSRSNSSNSRSSCSSSTLASPTSTSSSFSSSPSPTSNDAAKKAMAVGTKNLVKKPARVVQPCNVSVPRPRWYFIRPAPVLISSVEIGRRKKAESKAKTSQVIIKKRSRVRSWFGWRYFRSIIWACKACHALDESSTK